MTARMPDGNAFAERQHDAAQARAESRHDAHGDDAIQSVIDDLFAGRKVAGLTLVDFVEVEELIANDELAAFLLADRDTQHAMIDALRKRVTHYIRNWCSAGRGAWEVAERVRGRDEDARADASEARRAVREAI